MRLQEFFNEQMDLECSTVYSNFILEIAANFEGFFIRCLPYFIKTIMLVESIRLHTFLNRSWPHNRNFVSMNDMAISGLYFTGEDDNVKCVFCPIHKWIINDDPIADHFKFNRNCCFLRNHRSTSNVSDVTSEKKLRKRLSHLPQYGIDGADRANSNTE